MNDSNGVPSRPIQVIDQFELACQGKTAPQIFEETRQTAFRWSLQDRIQLDLDQDGPTAPSTEELFQQAVSLILIPSSAALSFAQVCFVGGEEVFPNSRSRDGGMRMMEDRGGQEQRPQTVEKIQQLIRRYRRGGMRETLDPIREEIVQAGEVAVKLLIEVIRSMERSAHEELILAEMGYGQQAAKALIENLIRSGKTKREILRKALEGLGDVALDELAKLLTPDTDVKVRRSVAEVLSEMSHYRSSIILSQALDDPDDRVRFYAQRLANVPPGVKVTRKAAGPLEDPLDRLIQCLSSDDEEVRASSINDLGDLGDQRAVAPLMERLLYDNQDIQFEAAIALGKLKDPSAIGPLVESLRKPNDMLAATIIKILSQFDDQQAVEAVVSGIINSENDLSANASEALNRKDSDDVIVECLKKNPSLLPKKANWLESLARRYELQATLDLVHEWRFEEDQRRILTEKVRGITEAIQNKITEVLGLNLTHDGMSAEGNEVYYGHITMDLSLSQELEQRLDLKQILHDTIEIEVGNSLEEQREHVKTLNFLIPHLVAHVIQKKLKFKEPTIDLEPFPHLDAQSILREANRVLLDKLGFEAARKIYVHGDGDILFNEGQREAIAIEAYATLLNIILRNLESEKHTLPDENIVRFIAVAIEMSKSDEIIKRIQQRLQSLANEFYAHVTSGKDEETVKEVALLISKYREIFKSVSLPL